MCGIAGIFAYHESAPPVDPDELLRIREAMIKRGPDGAGLWIADDRRIGLANRRLAIIDTSEAGAQPMATADGRYRITYNGEIYNFRELRKELEAKGHHLRSNSDTEVLLYLYAEYGAAMLQCLRGMFAFAIWDEREKTLFLARDPFGIKPLYYADDGKTLRFASQVKALLAGGAIDTAPESAGAVGFLLWGSVPEPYTLYRNISALPAGSHLTMQMGKPVQRVNYFSVREELVKAQAHSRPFFAPDREALAQILRDAVYAHLIADVPVGIFLSSGMDSTLITALAGERGGKHPRTFTLGFNEYRNTIDDEVPLAEQTAIACGMQHETRWINRTNFENELDAILAAMDQPSIDGVNMYLVCREAARTGIKVALTGLGGDELFGGYPSFRDVPKSVRWLRPASYLPYVGRLLRYLSVPVLSKYTSPKYAGLLEYGGSFEGAYFLRRALFMPWELREVLDPVAIHTGLERLQTLHMIAASIQGLHKPHAKVAAMELAWYLRNQLLRDTDWAGMAHSLEVRTPFVDVTLFRKLAPWLVAEITPTKTDTAAAPRTALSEEILKRRKSGFSVPVREWLEKAGTKQLASNRGLRGWARRVLPPQPKQFRALMLVSDAYGGYGGIAKFNRDFISGLVAMPECAEVIVIPRLVMGQTEPIPPRVKFLMDTAESKLRFVTTTLKHTVSGTFNIVFVAHINFAPFAVLIGKLLAAKTVLTIYGIDAWNTHRNPLVRNCLQFLDSIISISEITLQRFNGWASLDQRYIHLLPPAVDLSQFTPGPKPVELARQLELKDRLVLLTLGRLASEERYKGFDEVIEALPELTRKFPNISYLICGDGPDRARLEEKARTLGVGGRVVFAGFVPEARKVEYYRLADAYVMPSRGEGFGIVFLEALACGLPVMGSTMDGSREALLNGELGILVDPENAIQVQEGITQTLTQHKDVSDKLEHYSTQAFNRRLHGIVAETLVQ